MPMKSRPIFSAELQAHCVDEIIFVILKYEAMYIVVDDLFDICHTDQGKCHN